MTQALYTTAQYPGAFPNGSRVAKIGSEPADAHQDGALARVLGSIGASGQVLGYFVAWDDMPNLPCFIAPPRLRLAEGN